MLSTIVSVFSTTLPFFALVCLGYLAVKLRWLPVAAISGLNTYVLFFALPCMLFRFCAATPLAQLLAPGVITIYLICACIMVGLALLLCAPQTNWNNAAWGALVAAFPNTGFMGVPLLVALLGAQAAGPIIMTIAVDMLITTSLCVGLSRLDSADQHGIAVAVRKALLGIASNPMPWAILLGGSFSAFEWQLLAPVDKTVMLLGQSASPVALFTIGAVLARNTGAPQVYTSQTPLHQTQLPQAQSPQAHAPMTLSPAIHPPTTLAPLFLVQNAPSAWRDVWLIASLKLFVHPLVVLLIGACAYQLGMPIDAAALKIIVLVAALPSASNVAMLTERFLGDTTRIARIILVSTCLAFVSFSMAVVLLA